jgi:hypothetical protein
VPAIGPEDPPWSLRDRSMGPPPLLPARRDTRRSLLRVQPERETTACPVGMSTIKDSDKQIRVKDRALDIPGCLPNLSAGCRTGLTSQSHTVRMSAAKLADLQMSG